MRILLAALAAAALCGPAAARNAPANVRLVVDLGHPGPVIAPAVEGQFAENLGRGIYGGIWVGHHSPIPNRHGYRTGVMDALKALHVPVIRWPGGCFADTYDWRDGIGQAPTFWLYAAFNLVFIAFTIWLVPETKGVTLEQIERKLMAGEKLRRIGQ